MVETDVAACRMELYHSDLRSKSWTKSEFVSQGSYIQDLQKNLYEVVEQDKLHMIREAPVSPLAYE